MSKLKEVLSDMAEDYRLSLVRGVSAKKLTATNRLKKSIKSTVKNNGFEITSDELYSGIVLGSDGAGVARNNGDGSKTSNIRQWVKAKGIRPLTRLSGGGVRFSSKRKKDKNSAEDRMVFAISRAISEKGTIKRFGYKGSDILNETYDRFQKRNNIDLEDALKEDIVNGIVQDFKFDNLKIQ